MKVGNGAVRLSAIKNGPVDTVKERGIQVCVNILYSGEDYASFASEDLSDICDEAITLARTDPFLAQFFPSDGERVYVRTTDTNPPL